MTRTNTPAEASQAKATTVRSGDTAQLSDAEKAAYRALMRVVFAVPRAVSADLVSAGGLGLTEHLVLQNLLDAPGRQLRVTELALACGVSVSGITRIVDRLDRAGLTTRARSTLDGRGAVAALTPAGAATLERARAAHAASIRRHVFDRLANCDLAAFTTWLESIAGQESPRSVRKNILKNLYTERSGLALCVTLPAAAARPGSPQEPGGSGRRAGGTRSCP